MTLNRHDELYEKHYRMMSAELTDCRTNYNGDWIKGNTVPVRISLGIFNAVADENKSPQEARLEVMLAFDQTVSDR